MNQLSGLSLALVMGLWGCSFPVPPVKLAEEVPDAAVVLTARDVPWQHYVGTQYSFKPYGTAARDVGGAQRYGLNAGDLPGSLRDFTSNTVPMVATHAQTAHAMTLQVGGLGSGRDPAVVATYMNAIAADSARIVDMYATRARLIATIPGASGTVYWQLGNEINTTIFSENLHLWAGDGVSGRMHDTSTIPWLVEYFIAPAVAGIASASQEVHGRPDEIRIMLGSIAIASNPSAQAFMNQLLDYQVVGTFAPTLAGRQVFDLVDTISVHYVMAGPTWRATLEGIRTARLGQGRIRRVMSTEEVGIRAAEDNRGTSVALRALSRYLSWWQEHDLLPDDSRLFFYGHGQGSPSIDTELTLLGEFTGTLSLVEERGAPWSIEGAQNLEAHEFRVGPTEKRVFVAFSSDLNQTSLSNVSLAEPGWASARVTAVRYGADVGKVNVPVTISAPPGGRFQLDFGGILVGPQDALLVTLESGG